MINQKITRTISIFASLGILLGAQVPISAQATAIESCVEDSCTVTFAFTGSIQNWSIPTNARNLSFELYGAQGGHNGGAGGKLTGQIANPPNQLFIVVGGQGLSGVAVSGGYNGGGASGSGNSSSGSGGGATELRFGSEQGPQIAIAGGGGGRGAGLGSGGGIGGGLVAGAGKTGQGVAGSGGSQLAGGLGGAANGTGTAGTAGSLAIGGTGGSSTLFGGGGGGGGYFGGGGGGSDTDSCCSDAGGGGGGSSFTDSDLISSVVHTAGNRVGSGLAILRYQLVPLVESITADLEITNQDQVSFQVEFNMNVFGLEDSDILINHNQGSCVASSVTGFGASYTVTLFGCNQGTVSITLNSYAVYSEALDGPEQHFESTTVTIDQIAPEVIALTASLTQFSFELSELITDLEIADLVFYPENPSCLISSLDRFGQTQFIGELTGCEAGYQLIIESESLIDLAGNFGPTGTQMIFFEAAIFEPAPDSIQEGQTNEGVVTEKESESISDSDPESDSESQSVLPLIPPAMDQPVESGSNEPSAPNQPEVASIETEELVAISAPRASDLPEKLSDGEVIQPPLRQAAARLILPETSFESTSNSWIIWLAAAIALAITGYLVSRRGRLPEIVTS